jgi:hypothetical protein
MGPKGKVSDEKK